MKNILITGGSKGIGLALTYKFAGNNFHVITISRDTTPLHGLSNITSIQGDITIDTDLDKLINVINDFPSLDGIISNAAHCTPEPLKLTTNYEIEKHFATNFFAPIKLIQKVLQQKKTRYVINLSSGAATLPLQSLFSYCTSKAAMHHAIHCLNVEYPETKFANVRPGMVKTEMHKKLCNADDSIFPDGNYIKHMAQNNSAIPTEKVADYIFKIWQLPSDQFAKDWNILEDNNI